MHWNVQLSGSNFQTRSRGRSVQMW
ncbi:DUF6783 domain-containing protein [uncultured Robinsoniella sp.]